MMMMLLLLFFERFVKVLLEMPDAFGFGLCDEAVDRLVLVAPIFKAARVVCLLEGRGGSGRMR